MPATLSAPPSSLLAGDSVTWTVTDSNYPPSAGYTLAYKANPLEGQAGTIFAISGAVIVGSGATYTVTLPSATTAAFIAGDYILAGYVTLAADRYTVSQTPLKVLADPTSAAPETHASRTLALIEAAIEGRIPRGLEETIIDGQTLIRIPIPELVKLRAHYRDLVKNEAAQNAIAAGLRNPRNFYARFRAV